LVGGSGAGLGQPNIGFISDTMTGTSIRVVGKLEKKKKKYWV